MRKLNEPELREHYQIEITNRFAALENVNEEEDVNRTWEHIKENIQTSAKETLGLHELNQNKPLRKNGNTENQFISSLQTSRKLTIQLGGRSYIRFSWSLVSLGKL